MYPNRSRLPFLFIFIVTGFTNGPNSPTARCAEPSRNIASVLQPFVDHHTLAGAVTLVADKDKVLSLEAVGWADIAARKSMTTDALFWIASQSKSITAAAFIMLVDEGNVRLDDPVEKFLPEFKDEWVAVEKDKDHMLLKRPRHPITVREILSHRSGLAFKSALEEPTLDLRPLRVAVRSYAMTPLLFQPGTNYRYANAGINTAGRIIEVVSGMPYEQFLEKRLFIPLGMKDTTFWPSEEQLRRLAKSYKPNAAKNDLVEIPITQLHYPLNDRCRQPMPAGGLFSTVNDLARLCQMMLNHGVFRGRRLLSAAAVKEMTTKQTPPEVKTPYGLGWSTGGGTFGHGDAYATNMTVDAKSGLIMIFLVQHAGFPGDGSKSQAAFRQAALAKFSGGGR